jgi:ribosomal protein L22
MDALRSLPQSAAKPILLVLQQALGNAKNNFSLSPEGLVITGLEIEEGPRYKRRDAHSHGARFDSGIRRRRTSHIIVTLNANQHGSKS